MSYKSLIFTPSTPLDGCNGSNSRRESCSFLNASPSPAISLDHGKCEKEGSWSYVNEIADISLLQVSKLSELNSNPTFTLRRAKRVFRHAIHTRLKYGLGSNTDHEVKLVAYGDTDHGSNLVHRKPTAGCIFVFNGGPISWSSQKPTVVSDGVSLHGTRQSNSRLPFQNVHNRIRDLN